MNRRTFIAALGGAAAWPVALYAQQSSKIPKIGVLWHAANEQQEAPFLGAFRQGLNELGYVEGKNIQLLNRFADEHYDRFDALAGELVEARVDVILASILPAASAAKRASTMIPIVFAVVSDPVGAHLVDSLADPGGNLTGLSPMFTDLTGKCVEILKDCLPELSSITLLVNPNNPVTRAVTDNAQIASRAANVKLSVVEAGKPDDLQSAFLLIAQQKPDAVVIGTDTMFLVQRKRIAELAVEHRLPTIGAIRDMAEAGVLFAYGPDGRDLFRRSASYVDKILKGAKPNDLPVERATKFNFVVNFKTARAIGLSIPGALQARADEVIE
jgi:putative tryptophan/tyrosine transport system substrate-binding protein